MSRIIRETQDRILDRDDWTCQYCGHSLFRDGTLPGGPTTITVDHVVPVSAGGPHAEGNLVAACHPCNRAAGNRVFPDFAAKREYVIAARRAPRWGTNGYKGRSS